MLIALQTLHDPQQEEILAWITKLSLPFEPKGEKLAPWAADEERQVEGEAGEFDCRPFEVEDAILTEGMAAPEDVGSVVSVVEAFPANWTFQTFFKVAEASDTRT